MQNNTVMEGNTGSGGQAGAMPPMNGPDVYAARLIELIHKVRPADPYDIAVAEKNMERLLIRLQQEPSTLQQLRQAILSEFRQTRITSALSDSGIITSRGFIQELGRKMKHKILPDIPPPGDFLHALNRVFYDKDDHIWVSGMAPSLWVTFFDTLGIRVDLADPWLIGQLNASLQTLSTRLSALGLQPEITSPMRGAGQDTVQPFSEQARLVRMYAETTGGSLNASEGQNLLNNLSETLHNCRQSILSIKNHRSVHGTSLAQTYIMVLMEQQIERMFVIVDILDQGGDFLTSRFVQYFTTLVRFENRKNSIRGFLSETFSLLAYQIAEHKGKKGQHYIAQSRNEYIHLFRSSMAGGFIVSFVAIFKNLLGFLPFAPFWKGLVYGVNYATGFVVMDLTHSTLATKQPAYTASTVAQSLDPAKQGGRPDLRNLAITVAGIVRSQTASFAGNLLVVFPLAYLLAWGYHLITGLKIAEGPAADALLLNQHPFRSLSLLYACFTGVFLFLSGLIAGYVENAVVYGRVPERLLAHPTLSVTMKPQRLANLSRFVRRNAGPLSGSIALGFFLGMAGPLGSILAIPFDIRHITISAGNVGIAFYGLDHKVPLGYLLTIISGVLMIGFLNFLVSFSLAFFVAIRSRRIRLREYTEFLGILGRYMRRYPADFFIAPAEPRNPGDLPE